MYVGISLSQLRGEDVDWRRGGFLNGRLALAC